LIDLLFSTTISVIITASTLVVTISQLVISQENGPLGEQRTRMSNTMDFRDFTEEMIGAPSPPNPSEFLRQIVATSERRAHLLRDSVAGNPNAQLRAEVDEFTESTHGSAEEVQEQLDEASFGTFDVLNAALDYNYGIKIFHVERIANDYTDDLTDEDMAILDDLKAPLSMFGPAREHIKTLYFEWSLINLSQLMLYASVPALLLLALRWSSSLDRRSRTRRSESAIRSWSSARRSRLPSCRFSCSSRTFYGWRPSRSARSRLARSSFANPSADDRNKIRMSVFYNY
jgi:hypothetical protein